MSNNSIKPLSGNERVAVPSHLLSSRGDHYVLLVVGDSMVNEGILDGDYVIVLRNDAPESGQMVICIVGDSATIKRYVKVDDETVRLQSVNSAIPPINIPAKDVRVQGIVVGLMRKM